MGPLSNTEVALAVIAAMLAAGWLTTVIRFARYREKFSVFDPDGNGRPGGRRRGF